MRHFILSTAVAVGLMTFALDDASAQGRSILEIGPSTDRSIIVEQFLSGTVAPSPVAPTAAPSAAMAPPAQSSGTTLEYAARVTFDHDSDALRQDEMAKLDTLAGAIMDPALGNAPFLVEGHTNATGSWEYNRVLSQRRADSVRLYLIQRGVSPSRLRTIAYSWNKPDMRMDPRDPRQRRVEVGRTQ